MPKAILDRASPTHLIRAMGNFVTRLRKEKRGNVLMILGFALIPLTFAAGMAIDYSRAGRLQTKLNAAADAAVLAANAKPMLAKSMMAACNASRRTFLNSLEQYRSGLTFNATTGPTITITETYLSGPSVTFTCPFSDGTIPGTFSLPATRTVKVDFVGTSANAFGGVLGANTITIGGTATAKASTTSYIDVYVALDTSQSMGLAASAADALALWNATKTVNGPSNGCTFGCHAWTSSNNGYNNARISNDRIAQNYGIRLRINALRDAMTTMVQSAIDNTSSTNFYRFGLYRIGANHSVITARTSNLSSVKTTASTLSLGVNTSAGTGDTNLTDTMNDVLPLITARGDGTTQANARPFFFLVTDGVEDVAGGCTYGHCTKPLDPAMCQTYKNAGITVGVVYTTYLPVYQDPTNPANLALRDEYANLVKDFSEPAYSSPNPSDNSRDIKPALEACASPGWFFEAEDEDAIAAAMDQLFRQASRNATLTR